MRALAHRIALAGPSDVRGLDALLDRGALRPDEVVAIVAKTEGNGGRNDFTRELAARAFADALARRLGVDRETVESRVVISVSGGTEGVASPHAVVFGRRDAGDPPAKGEKRLAIAVGHTRALVDAEIGRAAQIEETAKVVQALMKEVQVTDPKDVHLVQIKGALPAPSGDGARSRNDMVHSRAASALGVAVALGEIDATRADDDAVARDFSLWSEVASVSAKPGLARGEIVMLANSPAWSGDLAAGHGVMRDILDGDALATALASLGLAAEKANLAERVIGVFAKAEADASRLVRGHRHVMLDDDDVSDTRWARCTVAAVLAGRLGHGAIYVSTRAEHMGPAGGGPVAVVARVGP